MKAIKYQGRIWTQTYTSVTIQGEADDLDNKIKQLQSDLEKQKDIAYGCEVHCEEVNEAIAKLQAELAEKNTQIEELIDISKQLSRRYDKEIARLKENTFPRRAVGHLIDFCNSQGQDGKLALIKFDKER